MQYACTATSAERKLPSLCLAGFPVLDLTDPRHPFVLPHAEISWPRRRWHDVEEPRHRGGGMGRGVGGGVGGGARAGMIRPPGAPEGWRQVTSGGFGWRQRERVEEEGLLGSIGVE